MTEASEAAPAPAAAAEPAGHGRLATVVFAVGVAAVLAHLVVVAFQQDESCDLPWHLAIGDEVLDTHRIPLHDRYSYSFAGRPYSTVPWLGEAALALSYRAAGGLAGPMVLRLACLLVAFGLLFRVMRAWGAGRFLTLGLLAVTFELAHERVQLRPEMFLPPFAAVVLALLQRHESRGSRGGLLAVVPVMALFANIHMAASALLLVFVYAYAGWRAAAFLARGRLPRLLGPPAARAEAAWCVGVAVLATGAILLNPTFTDPLRFARLNTPLMLSSIVEYAHIGVIDRSPTWLAFVALALVTVPLGWHRRSGYGLLAIGALALAAVRWARMSGPFVLGATPFVAASTAVAVRRALDLVPAARRSLWRGVVAAGMVALVGLAGWQGYASERLQRSVAVAMSPTVYPEAATSFLRDHPSTGRLFNDYGLGGYLLWRLGPETQVLIDGRTPMLYDGPFFARYMEAKDDPEAFAALCRRYGITRAIRRAVPPAFHLTTLPGWQVVYFDDVAVVYAADAPAERGLRARFGLRYVDPLRPERLLLLAGDPARAPVVAEAERAAAAQPRGVLAHRLRAVLAAVDGDVPRVAAESAWLARAGVAVDRAGLEIGLSLARGQARRALAELQAARRDDPFDRLLRGRALLLAGDRAAARAVLEREAALPEALLWLGDAAAADGDVAGARRWHDRFLHAVGSDPLYASRVERVQATAASQAASAPSAGPAAEATRP